MRNVYLVHASAAELPKKKSLQRNNFHNVMYICLSTFSNPPHFVLPTTQQMIRSTHLPVSFPSQTWPLFACVDPSCSQQAQLEPWGEGIWVWVYSVHHTCQIMSSEHHMWSTSHFLFLHTDNNNNIYTDLQHWNMYSSTVTVYNVQGFVQGVGKGGDLPKQHGQPKGIWVYTIMKTSYGLKRFAVILNPLLCYKVDEHMTP